MTTKLGPDKLSVVVFSGEFDKVHYALVMASGAQSSNRQTTLFFTMGACRALLKTGADGEHPWREMALSGQNGAENGGARDDQFKNLGVGAFEELLSACVEMGVTFMVCEMGLRAEGLSRADLREDIPFEEGGVVTFLNNASKDGSILFI
jgi:peroxiredoxin family protein